MNENTKAWITGGVVIGLFIFWMFTLVTDDYSPVGTTAGEHAMGIFQTDHISQEKTATQPEVKVSCEEICNQVRRDGKVELSNEELRAFNVKCRCN